MAENVKDIHLVGLAKKGDSEAISALLVRYSNLVSLRAAAFTCAFCEKEDLEQEGLLAVMNAVRTYDENKGASFRTYLGECIDNRMISFIRVASRQNRTSGTHLEVSVADNGETDPETLVIGKEGYEKIMSLVTDSLSDYEKRVLALYVEGLSYAEMGERFNKSAKSVGNALARVREKLYSRLKK